ncbi:zinc-ribbon domain containing protein [Usitatibacter rugosus]|uniref:zinc-ribbon domain containing protein n=1 Tax=Usitatibacter rugosus TaxID=2732067 RepID=UPI001487A57C|nr:zinc-ribbon domain containing protein [Usitatibacter rugosus]
MTSGRERRTQLKQRRTGKREALALAAEKERTKAAAKARAARLKGQVLVNPDNLRPTNSYRTPDFVDREFYVDRPFQCKDCGTAQIWTATQQKWWYESAKGDVWTVAVRCRTCRRREQARKAAAEASRQAGLARKRHAT